MSQKMKAPFHLPAAFVALCCTVNVTLGQQISGQLTFGGNYVDYLNSFTWNEYGIFVASSSVSSPSGDKQSPHFGNGDYWIMKFDEQFSLGWENSFGGTNTDIPLCAIEISAGVVVGGKSNSPISGNKTAQNKGEMDYWVIALGTGGEELWQQTYGGSDYDALTAMVKLPDGNLLLGGVSSSAPGGDRSSPQVGTSDFWLVKIDPQGQKIWDRAYGGIGSQGLNAMTALPDGRILMAGNSDSPISGDKTEACYGDIDGWLLMTDANGNKIWDRTIGGSGSDAIVALAILDGHIYAGAYSNSPASGTKTQDFVPGSVWPGPKNDYWVTKLTLEGSIVWDHTYGSSENDNLTAMIAANGQLYLSGESGGGVSGNKTEPSKGGLDYWLVKIDTAGAMLWDRTIGGPGMDQPYALTTANGKILVGGGSNSDAGGDKEENSRGYSDIWIVGLDISSGLEEQSAIYNERLSIYPNPVGDKVRVQLQGEAKSLRLTDPLGRTVLNLRPGALNNVSLNGNEGIELSVADLPSGIYIVAAHLKDGTLLRERLVVQH